MAKATLTADSRARVLANGHALHLLGLGVWHVRRGRETENAVRWARGDQVRQISFSMS